MDLEQEIERIARQHELGSYCGSQFILDRRCLAALREMAAFTRKQTLEEAITKIEALKFDGEMYSNQTMRHGWEVAIEEVAERLQKGE